MKRKSKCLLVIMSSLLLAAVVGILMITFLPKQDKKPVYSEIIGYFQSDTVQSFSLNVSSGSLTADLTNGSRITYAVPDVELFISQVTPLVTAHNQSHPDNKITYDYVQAWDSSQWLNALPYLLIFAAGMTFVFFRYGSRGKKHQDTMPLAQMKAEKTPSIHDKKTFADVAGADEEKEELKDMLQQWR